MYSPTMRLLAVLTLLQSRYQMNGAEIASHLEVDPRTVRRYITTLQDMGIPIESERGPHGAYRLGRGSKMPPLMFTNEEAVVLTLGLLFAREYHFPVEPLSTTNALAKIERVLPENLLQQVRSLQEAITFNIFSYKSQHRLSIDYRFVVVLSLAIQAQQQVHINYCAQNKTLSQRDFDPYGIVYNEGYWYVAGYCHLRKGLRTFRLDRILSVEELNLPFERPPDFDPLNYVMGVVVNVPSSYFVEVLLKTSLEHAQVIIPPYLGTLEETPDGVILKRTSTRLQWIAFALLSLDVPIEIKQPNELRQLLQDIAKRANLMAKYNA